LSEIILLTVILSGYFMLFFLRMSIKQVVFVWVYIFLSALGIYLTMSKNYGLMLVMIGTSIACALTLCFYLLKLKKDGLKFDEPFFEKGYFKLFIKCVRDIYSKNNKI
jgi:hypothetical protein